MSGYVHLVQVLLVATGKHPLELELQAAGLAWVLGIELEEPSL